MTFKKCKNIQVSKKKVCNKNELENGKNKHLHLIPRSIPHAWRKFQHNQTVYTK